MTTATASKSTKTKKIPAHALEFAMPTELGDVQENGGVKRAPIKLTAVSGEPFDHWYWDRMVIDVDGMQAKGSVSLDYCHDTREVVGFGKVKRENGQLVIDGELVALADRPEDRAHEVMLKGAAGVPYEASVKFDRYNGLAVEFYESGAVAFVNGKSFVGPITVLRQSLLRGVAVCPYGADPYTSSEFAAGDDSESELTITHFSAQEAEMSSDSQGKPADQQPAAELNDQQTPPEEKPAEQKPEWQAQLADYTERFGGELGAKWLAEGKSLPDAYTEFVAKLREQHAAELKAATDKAAELQSQLDQLSLGEDQPLSTTPAEGNGANSKRVAELSNSLPEGLARFAAGIKLPAKES